MTQVAASPEVESDTTIVSCLSRWPRLAGAARKHQVGVIALILVAIVLFLAALLIGMGSAYARGFVDLLGQRLVDMLLVFPGVAMTVAVRGFNLLGDTLRDVFDPRLRGS